MKRRILKHPWITQIVKSIKKIQVETINNNYKRKVFFHDNYVVDKKEIENLNLELSNYLYFIETNSLR